MSNPQGLEPGNTQAHNQRSGPLELMSDAEVRAAILQGKHDGSPSMIGLYLNDVQTNVLSHVLTPEQATNGFLINEKVVVWVELPAVAVIATVLDPLGVVGPLPHFQPVPLRSRQMQRSRALERANGAPRTHSTKERGSSSTNAGSPLGLSFR